MKSITQLRAAKQLGDLSGRHNGRGQITRGAQLPVCAYGDASGMRRFPADASAKPNALEAAVRDLPVTDRMVGDWCTMDVSAEGLAERLAEMAKPIVGADPMDLAEALCSEALNRVLGIMVETESYRSASVHASGLVTRALRDGKAVGLGAPLGYSAAELENRMNQEDARAAWLDALEATLYTPTFPHHLSYLLRQALEAGSVKEGGK